MVSVLKQVVDLVVQLAIDTFPELVAKLLIKLVTKVAAELIAYKCQAKRNHQQLACKWVRVHCTAAGWPSHVCAATSVTA